MKLNHEKSKVLSIGLQNQVRPIEEANCIEDIGVTVLANLTFTSLHRYYQEGIFLVICNVT